MIVYGLTGGIGSGKSTVRKQLQNTGISTLDADEAARIVVATNQPGLIEIERVFGTQMLINGTLNRSKMRRTILQDTQAKKQLEAILHPLIRQHLKQQIEQLTRQGTQVIIVEIPLLTEIGKPDYIDKVILLDVSESTQKQRAMQRQRHTETEVDKIMRLQATRSERLQIADIIINAEQPLEKIIQDIRKAIVI